MTSPLISKSLLQEELEACSVADLLLRHTQIHEALLARGVLRSANSPTGDLAEYLFCRAFGWQQAKASERGFDATGADGTRYQIKGRQIGRGNASRQLSAIRDLQGGHFDVLAGVLFGEGFKVLKAALIPVAYVIGKARFSPHTRSSIFMLRDEVWQAPGVRDVTAEIEATLR
ncbi:hypothetical protein [Kerstersia sp.]|uniref:hypothetical protein n=1 Tax=Kerstersia sp. TaxID=1930783 RepID=UPI003F8DFD39